MKKTFKHIITIFSFLLLFVTNTSIANATVLNNFNDDYYVETVITDAKPTFSFSTFQSNSHTITKTKTTNIKNTKGTVLWSVSITATFTHDGSTSRCISCSPNAKAYASSWAIQSTSCNKNGTVSQLAKINLF